VTVGGFEASHRWADIPGDRVAGSLEHDLGLELPADRQMLLQQIDVVHVIGWAELLAGYGSRPAAIVPCRSPCRDRVTGVRRRRSLIRWRR
jgi:hypothetical protein